MVTPAAIPAMVLLLLADSGSCDLVLSERASSHQKKVLLQTGPSSFVTVRSERLPLEILMISKG